LFGPWKALGRLLSISRSSFYATPQGESDANLTIMAEIDRQFLDTPFYGVRQMTWHLRAKGWQINVKRVRRLASLRHAPSMTALLAAQNGIDADLSAPEDQHSGTRAQDLPVLAARPRYRPAESSPPLAESSAFVCRSRGAPTSPISRLLAASCIWSPLGGNTRRRFANG
jgi:hypothetical protein